jgi:uroporphyrinogen-III decarboxylase
MERQFYLDLAASGLRMPIGTHLQLHRHTDPEGILLDGPRLGEVIVEAAQRFCTPLAFPVMDLTLEKAALLLACGVPEADVAKHQFIVTPRAPADIPLTPRMEATCAALAHVANQPGLVPVGMAIGPFSLMTKLVSDPITPVFLAGTGVRAEDEPEVALVEGLLTLAEQVIHRYLEAQIAAGAKAVIVCEPAANTVYFSPNQLKTSFTTFDHFVMDPMRRIVRLLEEHGVDLIFHDCGNLTDDLISRFASLGAVMLSLGSSRRLWEDAALVPKDTVLYGNLPSKRFSAPEFTAGEVERLATELIQKMHDVGHPFILGSECDVLSVPGNEDEIADKVDAFMRCSCQMC